MAIDATVQIVHDGPVNCVVHLTGKSDGEGQENKVVKVDAGALLPLPRALKIMKIGGSVVGSGLVELLWDDDEDDPFARIGGGQVDLDWCRNGGLMSTAEGPGPISGDILLTTQGFELGSAYSLSLEMKKKY